jgi:hypothetical protein
MTKVAQGNVHLERKEATTLLMELLRLNLSIPSIVNLKEDKKGNFDLVLKADCDTEKLKEFIAQKGLTIEENKEKNYCVISRP